MLYLYMTTLIIEIPDTEVSAISSIIIDRGGNVIADSNDENLTENELVLLKRGLIEAISIKEGKLKSIPYSELWDE